MISITDEIGQNISTQGEKYYPNEACGFLLGTLDKGVFHTVKEILPINNAKDPKEQYHRFVISSDDYMRATLFAAKNGLEIVGFYHSHPDASVNPSEFDRENALPVYSYIIVSILNGKFAKIKSWVLSTDRKEFVKETMTFRA
jgi:proteasome lid subunit RPN8/RPN11